jgi:hypothetical protein
VTDAADLQARSVAERGYQGDDAAGREMHMLHSLTRSADHLRGTQLKLLAVRQQTMPALPG